MRAEIPAFLLKDLSRIGRRYASVQNPLTEFWTLVVEWWSSIRLNIVACGVEPVDAANALEGTFSVVDMFACNSSGMYCRLRTLGQSPEAFSISVRGGAFCQWRAGENPERA